jgi:hypothetical protein
VSLEDLINSNWFKVADVRAADNPDDLTETHWGSDTATRIYRLSRRDLLHRLEVLDQQRQRLVVQLDDLDRRQRGVS